MHGLQLAIGSMKDRGNRGGGGERERGGEGMLTMSYPALVRLDGCFAQQAERCLEQTKPLEMLCLTVICLTPWTVQTG